VPIGGKCENERERTWLCTTRLTSNRINPVEGIDEDKINTEQDGTSVGEDKINTEQNGTSLIGKRKQRS
jgi:hypothetical protein